MTTACGGKSPGPLKKRPHAPGWWSNAHSRLAMPASAMSPNAETQSRDRRPRGGEMHARQHIRHAPVGKFSTEAADCPAA